MTKIIIAIWVIVNAITVAILISGCAKYYPEGIKKSNEKLSHYEKDGVITRYYYKEESERPYR